MRQEHWGSARFLPKISTWPQAALRRRKAENESWSRRQPLAKHAPTAFPTGLHLLMRKNKSGALLRISMPKFPSVRLILAFFPRKTTAYRPLFPSFLSWGRRKLRLLLQSCNNLYKVVFTFSSDRILKGENRGSVNSLFSWTTVLTGGLAQFRVSPIQDSRMKLKRRS